MKTNNNPLAKFNRKISNQKFSSVNVKSFWKGSVMTDLNLPSTLFKNLQETLAEDFFAC